MLRLLTTTLLLVVAAGQALGDVVVEAAHDGYVQLAEEFMTDERLYIVQLEEPPALAYRGGAQGLPATRPARGQRFDADDAGVRRYGSYLMERHDAALRSVGAYQAKLYSYRYAFNGFAARMTPLQAQKLRSRRGVARVWEDRTRYLRTNDSARFLGLLDPQAGLRTAEGLQGEDVVIAVIDSGIAPEHPSFKDRQPADRPKFCKGSFAENTLLGLWLCTKFRRKDDRVMYEPPVDWNGACEAGDTELDDFTDQDCNNKLIGARFYIDGFLQRHLLDANEFISPRDADGHGTHIASTAAGNQVEASIGGEKIARISGIAPRARIAVYKACWLEPGQTRASCSMADLQRAIEDAVADGVDIINYSVGDLEPSITDPDDLALLAASDAGVLGVVAAGNGGPEPGSILSPAAAPWVLSVGASTRTGTRFDRAIRIDSPPKLAGNYAMREAIFTPTLKETGEIEGELVVVDDEIAGVDDGEIGTAYDGCEEIKNPDELDGKIAFMQRGLCNFEVKLKNAQDAGAIAAVVFNNEGGLIDMGGTRDAVDIPAVMIGQSDGQRLLDELNRGETVDARLPPNLVIDRNEEGDLLASQSARGPNIAAPDVLKPDVVAPGVDILAGHTPDVANGIRGELFQYLTGTSMAVPHVVGLAALIKEAKPNWSPAAIRSALMTTARQDIKLDDGVTATGPFDIGAGHVDPNKALDPGLIYEAGKADYDAFNCGSGTPRVTAEECATLAAQGYSLQPEDLNLPSIAIAELASRKTVTRRVTNAGDSPADFQASLVVPAGVDMSVVPDSLTLDPGETAEYQLQVSTAGASLGQWEFGSLTWDDGARKARSPIAVRPVNFTAPLAVFGTGATGSVNFEVEFGYDGPYEARATGLQAPIRPGSCEDAGDLPPCQISDDPFDSYVFVPTNGSTPNSVERFTIELEPGKEYAFLRIALFNEDTAGNDDLDLYVYHSMDGQLFVPPQDDEIYVSAGEDSNEFVEIEFPQARYYIVDVHAFDTDPQLGSTTEFELSVWALESGDNANLNVTAPAAATAGAIAPVSVQWSGLAPGRYLGGIEHRDAGGPLEPFTSIDVTVPVAAP